VWVLTFKRFKVPLGKRDLADFSDASNPPDPFKKGKYHPAGPMAGSSRPGDVVFYQMAKKFLQFPQKSG
jgi:hypothetical protein